jgi:hypothetical protein
MYQMCEDGGLRAIGFAIAGPAFARSLLRVSAIRGPSTIAGSDHAKH